MRRASVPEPPESANGFGKGSVREGKSTVCVWVHEHRLGSRMTSIARASSRRWGRMRYLFHMPPDPTIEPQSSIEPLPAGKLQISPSRPMRPEYTHVSPIHVLVLVCFICMYDCSPSPSSWVLRSNILCVMYRGVSVMLLLTNKH